jgi:hypothetical protein
MRTPTVSVVLAALLFMPPRAGMAQAPTQKAINLDAMRALWSSIKRQLAGPDGEQYFRDNLDHAALPLLIGKLLSATPEDQPGALVLSMSDGATPEVTLRVKDDNGKDSHLNGPLMPGSEIRFEGMPVAFTQNPFMLTLEVSTAPQTPRRRLR